MKTPLVLRRPPSGLACCLLSFCLTFLAPQAWAITSPYVTTQTNVPLAQATDDSINGMVPFLSHVPLEGDGAELSNATSATEPTANVIPGPDNTWIGMTWAFGDPAPGYMWQLNRLDAWLPGGDPLRKGLQADISVSYGGEVEDFHIVPNSKHLASLSHNEQFNLVRWDFPAVFTPGAGSDNDRYPVQGFRFIRVNSRGDNPGDDGVEVDYQSRFTEFDMWVTQVPIAAPRLTGVINSSGTFSLSWTALPGRTYDVEYSEDLIEWHLVDSAVARSHTETRHGNIIGNAFFVSCSSRKKAAP